MKNIFPPSGSAFFHIFARGQEIRKFGNTIGGLDHYIIIRANQTAIGALEWEISFRATGW